MRMLAASHPFDYELRQQIRKHLSTGESHATNTEAIDNFPIEARGKSVGGFDHNAWQILEHMRVAQADILDFCVNPLYDAPIWPDDYWPAADRIATEEAWDHSRQGFFTDLESMKHLIADPAQDLFVRIPWGRGQNLLREALLVAGHNSYHLGQLLVLRKALNGELSAS